MEKEPQDIKEEYDERSFLSKAQEKVKVEGLLKTEPQTIKEEYEETYFHTKPLDIKKEYQEESLFTKPVDFTKSVTPGIKSDRHSIKTIATADDSKRKMNNASPSGSFVSRIKPYPIPNLLLLLSFPVFLFPFLSSMSYFGVYMIYYS